MGPTDGSASKEEQREDKKKGNGNQMISSSMGHVQTTSRFMVMKQLPPTDDWKYKKKNWKRGGRTGAREEKKHKWCTLLGMSVCGYRYESS